MATNELINDLKRQLADIKKYKGEMDLASWGYEQGVLITGNEAKQIIALLEAQAKEPSDEDIANWADGINNNQFGCPRNRIAHYAAIIGAKAARDGKIKTQTK